MNIKKVVSLSVMVLGLSFVAGKMVRHFEKKDIQEKQKVFAHLVYCTEENEKTGKCDSIYYSCLDRQFKVEYAGTNGALDQYEVIGEVIDPYLSDLKNFNNERVCFSG